MAFGQSSGPPASAKQVAYLSSLVEAAGFASFREARHPLGLTQRQAGGKFTSQEASALIDLLLAAADEDGEGPEDGDRPPSSARSLADERALARIEEERAALAAGLPAEVMVLELERRGWVCSPPPVR